jgi:hypothetical protein
MIGAACNSRILQANLHAALKFVLCTQRIPAIILFIFESFVGAVVQNEVRLTEKVLFLSLKKVIFLLLFIHSCLAPIVRIFLSTAAQLAAIQRKVE